MSQQHRLDPAAASWREVDGEVVGLDLTAEEYFALKGSAVLLWRRLEQGATTEELLDLLEGSYGLTREQAADDLEPFLAGLRQRRLLLP